MYIFEKVQLLNDCYTFREVNMSYRAFIKTTYRALWIIYKYIKKSYFGITNLSNITQSLLQR